MQSIKCQRLWSLNLLLIVAYFVVTIVNASKLSGPRGNELKSSPQVPRMERMKDELQTAQQIEDDLPVHLMEQLNNILNVDTNSLQSKWNDEKFSSSYNYTGENANEQVDVYKAHQINRLLNLIFGRENLKLILTGVKDKITDGLTCKGVQTLVSIGRIKKVTKGTLSKLITLTCKNLGIETEKVCNGIGQMFAPPVKFILENTKLSNKEISAVVLGHKCVNSKDLTKYQSLNWKVFIPPHRQSSNEQSENVNYLRNHSSHPGDNNCQSDNLTERRISELQEGEGSTSFKFVHFTDIHLDLEYSVDAEVNCNEPVCCRSDVKDVGKGSESMKSRKWGETEGYCDSPMDLVEESLRHIGQTVKRSNGSIKYAIWTGDLIPHTVWKGTRQEFKVYSYNLRRLLQKWLPAKLPVLPILGNHEALPVNLLPPNGLKADESIATDWVFQDFLQQWKQLVPQQDEQIVLDSRLVQSTASYSVRLPKYKLRIIALNTLYCAKDNFWNVYNPVDLGGQLAYLVSQLIQAEILAESVHIIGHIPVTGQCTDAWYFNYLRILQRFKETIKVSFFGHTHKDHFFLYPNDSAVAIMSGSITTYDHVNPCYKVFTVQSDNGILLDQVTYFMEITETNRKNNPAWYIRDSDRIAFDMANLSLSEFSALPSKLSANETLRQLYLSNFHRNSTHNSWSECDDKCLLNLVKSIRLPPME